MLPTIETSTDVLSADRARLPADVRGSSHDRAKASPLYAVDESHQESWFDRARQGIHCSLFCGGTKCKLESWELMKPEDRANAAIEGLNSSWVGDEVIASQRPSTSLFVKYPLISQFRQKRVTGVLNLQEKGEHGSCGPDGVYESSGYSYNGSQDLMPHGVSYYEFPWPDMTAPQQDVVLRSVQVMDYHIKNKGKVLVHCHAGLGRTGLMIACYYVYSKHIPSAEAITQVRACRPGAVQTARQAQFIADFEKHLWRLSQAFRVEISDALIDVDLFVQRQRLVLHGETANSYRSVPVFLHVMLCRLLNLTEDSSIRSTCALQSVGPSSAPSSDRLAGYRIAINHRRFSVTKETNVSIISFLIFDWFRSLSTPVLSMEQCDRIVSYKRDHVEVSSAEVMELARKNTSKAARHTLGMVLSAFHIIGQQVEPTRRNNVTNFAFRGIVDSFNHAFSPVKLRHSPTERGYLTDFFREWAALIGDAYFNLGADSCFAKTTGTTLSSMDGLNHRTVRRIAEASRKVLKATAVHDDELLHSEEVGFSRQSSMMKLPLSGSGSSATPSVRSLSATEVRPTPRAQ